MPWGRPKKPKLVDAYQDSPVRRAEAARQRGDRYFRTQLIAARLTGFAKESVDERTDDTALIAGIETVGWQLVTANYLAFPAVNGMGSIVGVYLFRAV